MTEGRSARRLEEPGNPLHIGSLVLIELPLNPSQPITSTKLTLVGYALTKWFKALVLPPAPYPCDQGARRDRTAPLGLAGYGFATPVL